MGASPARALIRFPGVLDTLPATVRTALRHESFFAVALRDALQHFLTLVDTARLAVACSRFDAGAVAEALNAEAGARYVEGVARPRLMAAFLDGVEAGRQDLAALGLSAAMKRPATAISFDAINAEAATWARQHAGELVVAPAEVREIVNALISASQALGIPVKEVAKRIYQLSQAGVIGLDSRRARWVERFEARLRGEGVAEEVLLRRVRRYADAQRRSRAILIARTESISALSHGQQALWKQAVKSGLIDERRIGKSWITTPDDLVCPLCEPMDGEVVPIDGTFSGGVSVPPLHPACRCATGLAPLPKA